MDTEEQAEVDPEDFITTYADGIAIDEEHFPDEVFREYLKDNFDKDGDGNFSQGEIDSVTSIDVNGKHEIKSLVGISHFSSLKSLNCKWVALTSLDVSQNPNFRWMRPLPDKMLLFISYIIIHRLSSMTD